MADQSAPAAAQRYHGFDSLRAVMMLLGIYLHAVVAYSPVGGWPYKQPELTGVLVFTLSLIHVFRMPVFYVMAGFFAALLYQRRGLRGTAENRAQRILIPFVVGWIILFPLVVLLAGTGKVGLSRTLDAFTSGGFLGHAHPLHLWFLEYLLVLYVLAVVAGFVVALTPTLPWHALNRLFRATLQSRGAPIVLAVPSFAVLLTMRFPGFEDPPSFIPVPRIVIAYAIPFAFGWLLHVNADLLDIFRRRAWPCAILALIPIGLYLAPLGLPFAARCAIHSLALWLIIFAVIGLFDRYLSAASPRMRYICDSSYFLYLAHMPVILALQLLLLDVALPPLLKIPIVLTVTLAVLLVMYRYAVRPTVIGAVLNGRRYPNSRPARLTISGASI